MKNSILLNIINCILFTIILSPFVDAQHNAYLDIEGVDTANVCLKTSSYINPTILEFASGDTMLSHTHYYMRNQSDVFHIDVRSDLLGGGINTFNGNRKGGIANEEKNLYAPHVTDLMRLEMDGDMKLQGSIQLNSDPTAFSDEGTIRYNNGVLEAFLNGTWIPLSTTARTKKHYFSPLNAKAFSANAFSSPLIEVSPNNPSPSIQIKAINTSVLDGDFEWVLIPLSVPEGTIKAVTVCYNVIDNTSDGANAFISQVRLLTMNTPDSTPIIHDDPTDLSATLDCYTSIVNTTINGTITLALKIVVGSADTIEIGQISLELEN